MIIGVSRSTIQRNVLQELYSLLGFAAPSSKITATRLYDRNIYFVGAHDESAVRAIQGSTLALAYVDEIACIPKPFFRMLLSRLSVPGAQILATCNPEAPAHWLKKEFIDREHELDLIHWHFTLDDNPSLTEKYKEDLKKEYQGGHWHKRLILGEWAIAHGLVFDGFDSDNLFDCDYNSPNYYCMGIDYGTSNATAAVLAAITPKQWPQIRIEDEYYHDSRKAGRSKTDAELADDIVRLIGWKKLKAIYVDPSAASLKQELRSRDLIVMDARNDVLAGIRITSKFISQKNLLIHKRCSNLIEFIQGYAWDEKASDRGEDKPLKEQDHICDALRYLCYSAFPRGSIHHINDDMTVRELQNQIRGDNLSLSEMLV